MARFQRVQPPLFVVGLATAALLVVMLNYPVASSLAEAVLVHGRPSLAPQVDIAADPFYQGLFAFVAYQALLSALVGLALGLPGAYLLARYEFHGRRTLRSPTLVPFVLSVIMGPVGFASMIGGAQVVRDRDGTLSGATEPRKDGTVAAW
jgi:thiamine transport system permease protein